jgi:hypothetical protein
MREIEAQLRFAHEMVQAFMEKDEERCLLQRCLLLGRGESTLRQKKKWMGHPLLLSYFKPWSPAKNNGRSNGSRFNLHR